VWGFLTSIKKGVDAWTLPPVWWFVPTWVNYFTVLVKKGFTQYMLNSTIVAIGATTLSLCLGIPAAFSLSRFKTVARETIFFASFVAYIMPVIILALPLFLVMSKIGMLDNYLSLILSHSLYLTAFVIWMMRGFFEEIPPEIEEAAMVDGCSLLGALRRVVLPITAPGIAATTIFCVILSWNDFLLSLVLSGLKTKTMPVGVTQLIIGHGVLWGELCAAGIISTLPVLVFGILVQKHLIRGLTMGAVKG